MPAPCVRPRVSPRGAATRAVAALRECARRVVAEARLFDDRLCRPRTSPCLAPGSSLGREERELRLRQVDLFDAAGGQPALDGCEKLHLCTIGRAEQGVRNSSAEECGGDPKTVRRELIQRHIGVGERLLDTVRHHVRAQRGDPRLDRGAAVRERDLRGRPVGEGEPALGVLGSPRQRTPPGSEDGERRVLHELVVAEPPEPLLQRSASGRRSRAADSGRRSSRRRRPSRPLLARSRSPPRAGRWRCTRPSHER